jgi:beta-barrel assembly-enhancing protease
MVKILFFGFSLFLIGFDLFPVGVLYVQSPKAQLSPEPGAAGDKLNPGESVSPIQEKGLHVQVRKGEKTGWVSKLFLSPFPPGDSVRLNSASSLSENVEARQRASDFTKTAAARGLTETESLRVRGEDHLYDFESLVYLEKNSQPSPTSLSVSNPIPQSNPGKGNVPPTTQQEVKVGRSLAAKLLHKYGLVQNKNSILALNEMGRALSSLSSRTDLPFLFGILNTEEINAFACPGGFIFLTKGVMRSIQNEDELATILAHEITHVVLKHSGDFPTTNVFLEILSSLLASPGGEVVNAGMAVAVEQLEKQFFETGRSVALELDADEGGVFLSQQAGYNGGKLEDYLKRISQSKDSEILSKTHPDSNSRITRIKSVAGKNIPGSQTNPPYLPRIKAGLE